LNASVAEFAGDETEPKSKLKMAPEFFGADVVVAVLRQDLLFEEKGRTSVAYIDPEASDSVNADPPFVADTPKIP
jgi:hypothetical protein